MSEKTFKSYKVWDAPVRIFHGVNIISILVLLAAGLVIYNGSSFGVSGEGKILLKKIHVYAGYVFSINLIIRLVWAFMGNRHARFKGLLPMGKGYVDQLKAYWASLKTSKPQNYLGHNPLARIGLSLLMLVLVFQAVTGLMLAGTDIYFPPFGQWIAEWVAAAGVDPTTLVPGNREMVDAAAYSEMRAFRKPYITIHEYGFFALLALIPIHIYMAVRSDRKYEGQIISGIFTGEKHFSSEPVDKDE